MSASEEKIQELMAEIDAANQNHRPGYEWIPRGVRRRLAEKLLAAGWVKQHWCDHPMEFDQGSRWQCPECGGHYVGVLVIDDDGGMLEWYPESKTPTSCLIDRCR